MSPLLNFNREPYNGGSFDLTKEPSLYYIVDVCLRN